MSRDSRSDWKKFRKIMRGYSKRIIREFPSLAKKDWIVICFKSFKAFKKRFPTKESREKIIERLERADRQVVSAISFGKGE